SLRGFGVFLVVMLLGALSAYAHDIPNDVTMHMFLKPEGQRVQLLVRAPLAAMQDVQYTKLPNGFVDLSQIDFPLRNSAKLWISNNFQLFENDVLLPEPEILSVRPAILSDRSIASYEDFIAHLHG